MQIIVVHPKLKQAVSLKLGFGWLVLTGLSIGVTIALASGLLSYVTVRHALQSNLPLLQILFPLPVLVNQPPPAMADAYAASDGYLRDNIDALAVKLGQLQARLARMDAIGERVASLAGLKAADLPKVAGQGGPLLAGSRPLSLVELSTAIDHTWTSLDSRIDALSLVESELLMRTVTTKLLPTNQPLADGFVGSRFGGRIDPFTGRSASHEGIDFNAPAGTSILAAGAGVVVMAGLHHSYGNHVDIDHGNGVVTRYAHASRLLVKTGDIVRQGQKIAEVGTTGRSTGPHLHFEVRIDDEAQNPMEFLQQGLTLDRGVSATRAALERSRR